jgi:hypothetical protein
LYLQSDDRDTFWSFVAIGISTAMTRIMTAGATRATTTRTAFETVSCSAYGKEMLGSVKENGLWFGLTLEKPYPITATML